MSALEKELLHGLGVGVRAIEPIRGGGNNRLYRAVVSDEKCYAVKVYWRDVRDARDRLATEFDSLAFMWSHGLRCIPAPVFCDKVAGFAVYEYVQGERVDGPRVETADIGQVVCFLGKLREMSHDESARSLAAASDACFSVGDIVSGVRRRIRRLREVSDNGVHGRDMKTFLGHELEPFFEQAVGNAMKSLERTGRAMDSVLSLQERTLSPSDYGFHNALRRSDGSLVFVDFEYFGWDDPAKMVVDFILHPAIPLSWDQKRYFLENMVGTFGEVLRDRIRIVYPLHGVAWCTRLLNEFVPEHASRREFAFQGADDGRLNMEEQLQKARRKMHQIRRDYPEILQ